MRRRKTLIAGPSSPAPGLPLRQLLLDLGQLLFDLDSLERLIRWIAPRTRGRESVLRRLGDLKLAVPDRRSAPDAACLLARALDELYPQTAVISLARRRVRDMVLALAHT
jgi:hypothetical protein